MPASPGHGDPGSRRSLVGLAVPALLAFAASAPLTATPSSWSPVCTPQYPLGISCVNSVAIVKASPAVVVVPAVGPGVMVPLSMNVITSTGAQPGFACANPSSVLSGTISLVVCDTIPTNPPIAMNMANLGTRPPGFSSAPPIPIIVTIPAGTPPGLYPVKATVSVTFSQDDNNPISIITATGDTVICVVEPAPQDPSLPRLDLVTISNPLVSCPPGAQYHQTYRVTNNDPTHSVSLLVRADSEQRARMPGFDPGMNPGVTQSHYAISDPGTGDDFPIEFVELLPPDGVLPLPANPPGHDQPDITKQIVIAPGASEIIEIATRSYSGCSDGSCGENILEVSGTFANGDPAQACVGGALTVVNSTNPHLPVSYCTGKTNSLGCVPFMSFSGTPSAASTATFRIQGNDMIPGEAAFLFYSFQKSNLNFHGGKLCVKSPVARLLPPKVASATGSPPCAGVVKRNLNNAIQSGSDPSLTAGAQVRAQWFQRDPSDPAGFGDSLSNGLSFTIGP